MKKVVFTLLVAFGMVLAISSCRNDMDTVSEDLEQIDNDEVKEGDI